MSYFILTQISLDFVTEYDNSCNTIYPVSVKEYFLEQPPDSRIHDFKSQRKTRINQTSNIKRKTLPVIATPRRNHRLQIPTELQLQWLFF